LKSRAFEPPTEILDKLVSAGVELIYARDSVLGATLDVPPPSVDIGAGPIGNALDAAPGEKRGLAYRAARKIYRHLKRVEALQPILEELKQRVRMRL
jgi:hypothetical protein